MKKHKRILDQLTEAASREAPPAIELPPGMATRVLADVRDAAEPGYLAVLERWLVGAWPAALVLAVTLWVGGAPRPVPPGAPDADAILADALFEEALRP